MKWTMQERTDRMPTLILRDGEIYARVAVVKVGGNDNDFARTIVAALNAAEAKRGTMYHGTTKDCPRASYYGGPCPGHEEM